MADAPFVMGMARDVPVGSEWLMLDCFQGNRSPHTDPHARGAISGLSLDHTLGCAVRAVLEGVCHGTEGIERHRELCAALRDVQRAVARRA